MSRFHLQSLLIYSEDLVVEYIPKKIRRGHPIVMLCIKGRANDVPI